VTQPNLAAARSGSGVQWAALGGLAYVVLFIVGSIVMFEGAPSGEDASPAEVIAYYSDSGNRDRVSIGWILTGLGIFGFLWFLGALRQAVRRVDGDGLLTGVTTIGGTVYAALAFAAIALNTAIRTMSDDTYRNQVYPGLIHAADDAGYVIHATGGAAAGAMMIAASLAFLRLATVPRWAAWTGVALGVLAIGSIAFFPQIGIALWILAVAILLFWRGRAFGEPSPAT
jgi:hypothetical protein